jgi:RimJ/RimL family protein N-acetyltransferase
MILETERLLLRELTYDDFDALYAFAHYDFPAVYCYMKYTNIPSQKTAMRIGVTFVEEYPDPDNAATQLISVGVTNGLFGNKPGNHSKCLTVYLSPWQNICPRIILLLSSMVN